MILNPLDKTFFVEFAEFWNIWKKRIIYFDSIARWLNEKANNNENIFSPLGNEVSQKIHYMANFFTETTRQRRS